MQTSGKFHSEPPPLCLLSDKMPCVTGTFSISLYQSSWPIQRNSSLSNLMKTKQNKHKQNSPLVLPSYKLSLSSPSSSPRSNFQNSFLSSVSPFPRDIHSSNQHLWGLSSLGLSVAWGIGANFLQPKTFSFLIFVGASSSGEQKWLSYLPLWMLVMERITWKPKWIEGKASWTTSQGINPLQAKFPENELELWCQFI